LNQSQRINLQVTLSSIGSNARNNSTISRSRGNVLAREVAEEPGISLAERTRRSESVDLARAAEVAAALGVGGGVGRGEQLAGDGGLDDGGNVLEDVAFG
jgi:hypothetical protein